MNINKFTQKSMEAVQNCEKLAYEYGNQQIDQPHLLYSLLALEDSLIMKLITKMGIQASWFSLFSLFSVISKIIQFLLCTLTIKYEDTRVKRPYETYFTKESKV